jgi:D-galactarolactone cycloisomerase
MKITGIRTHVLEAKMVRPIAFARAWQRSRTVTIVEVETDQGLVGWGECYGPARLSAPAVTVMAEFLIGKDPLQSEFLWQELYANYRDHGQKGSVIEAMSGIDIALWDLKGKFFGQPVHRLMGGPLRTSVAAYATGLFWSGSEKREQTLAEEARIYCQQGFSAIKMKGGFGVAEDVRSVRAARQAIGDKVALMVDVNHAYDAVAAIALGRRIEEFDIGWLEEPVPPEDLASCREVKAALSIPIASGECEYTRFGFRDLLSTRAVDIVQPDLCTAGGLSECKKIADMAMLYGVRFMPHGGGTDLAIAATLQLIAVTPSLTPPSLNRVEPMAELVCTEHPFRKEVLTTPIEPRAGRLEIPDGPGLGVEVNRDALARFSAA